MVETRRILHTADWHLGATLVGRNRREEQFERIHDVVQLAIDRKVHVFVIAGDIFDRRLPVRVASDLSAMLADALLPLAQAGIPILIIDGNHDAPEWNRMLGKLTRLASVALGATSRTQQPIIVVQDADIVRVRGLQFVCLPYPPRELLAHAVGHDFQNEKDTAVDRNRAAAEAVEQILHKVVDSERFLPNVPSVLVAHMTTTNAVFPQRDEQAEGWKHDWSQDFMLPARAVPNRFVYGAFGHVHRPQDLHATKTGAFPFPARYSGSLVRLNINERFEDKSVTIVEIPLDGSAPEIEVVPLTQTPMAVVETSWTGLDHYEREREKWADVYVKVVVEHDGSVPGTTITSRVRRIFPRHIGIRLVGPPLAIRASAERLKDAFGLNLDGPADGVDWNPEDREGTVEAYVRERFADHPDLDELIRVALTITREASAQFDGVPTEQHETTASSAVGADRPAEKTDASAAVAEAA